ncbi:MAG TPA: hypothetical protein ENI23_12250 [bacterium]|nr:hypothetical protein [bacterium]
MDHRVATKNIYAFLDDELSHKERLALKKHIDSCSDCQQRIACEHKLRSVLKESLLEDRAPFYLKEKIRSAIEKIDKEIVIWKKYRISPQLRPIFSLMLGGLIILGVISSIFFYQWQRATRESIIFSRLAAKHIVFALQEDPIEITRGNAEELVDWFKGKVSFTFSIPIFFEAPDFLGGRLSELHHKGVVHLIYRWGDCRVSFFTFKSMAKDFPQGYRREYKGKDCYITKYNNQLIILWKGEGKLAHALVSDDEEELYEVASQIM